MEEDDSGEGGYKIGGSYRKLIVYFREMATEVNRRRAEILKYEGEAVVSSGYLNKSEPGSLESR